MPGGRLTHDDRRRIASGLAEGLRYAEIARRLGRPTSTVSREVSRNGGLHGYQPDQAHASAAQRARRRKPASSQATPTGVDAYGRDRAAVLEFEQRFAGMLIQSGFPRMMARVLICLLVSDSGSRTAAELVGRLQVSPASVSKAVRYLEQAQLVRRVRDPRQRRERYLVDDDVWYRSWSRIAQAYALGADTARQGVEILGADTPAGARLDEMRQFLTVLSRDMADAVEHWRQVLSAQRRQRPDVSPSAVP
ncbi:MAG TPA: helix-turn-helix domain-containing protein [Euzebyales bacterium]|nr:helix-turn-helix domain-containing protein [Euzebyales bacterium]